MLSDIDTGMLLQSLAASRPSGRLLELGTGLGLSTCWLLEGMDQQASLISVENDAKLVDFAKQALGHDERLNLHCDDGAVLINAQTPGSFDLIFADAWPGKYELLDETLALLKPGGIYLIDDMLPQPNWPEGHELKVKKLVGDLLQRKDLRVSVMNYSTGLLLCTKVG